MLGTALVGSGWAGGCAQSDVDQLPWWQGTRVAGWVGGCPLSPPRGMPLKGHPVPAEAMCPWEHLLMGRKGRGWHREADEGL